MRAKVGYCREGEPQNGGSRSRSNVRGPETRVRFAEKVMHVCAHKTMKFEDW